MNRAEISFLMDIYGNLLTEKQRDYMDLYYNNDLSLQEIAENEGISRQGVHDIIRRGESTLVDYEEKLGFISKLNSLETDLAGIEEGLMFILKKFHKNKYQKNIEKGNIGNNTSDAENDTDSYNINKTDINEIHNAATELLKKVRLVSNTITGG